MDAVQKANSGHPGMPMLAGHSVANRVIPEGIVDDDDLADHITNW